MSATTYVSPEGARAQHKRLTSLAAFVASVRLGRQLETPTPAEKHYAAGSDIAGIPGWSVKCRVGPLAAMAEHVDAAALAAEAEGSEHAAVILPRRGANLGGAYVTMRFSDWLAVVGETAPAEPVEHVEFTPQAPEASTAPLNAAQTAPGADPSTEPGPAATISQ
ncbi:hypothetical protein ACEXQB_010125 [Herbiconiux sp. P18]|uniref:hypothetical protein n=1 Tax=Herbiconiux liangxiaofengii TaxID=3342795 RepID=UPI0035B808A7